MFQYCLYRRLPGHNRKDIGVDAEQIQGHVAGTYSL